MTTAKHKTKKEENRKETAQKLLEYFGNPYHPKSLSYKERERILRNTSEKIASIDFDSKKPKEVSRMRQEILIILTRLDEELKGE